ncbi:MAG: histidine kinase [Desulfobacterales bacterium]|nr:histidine kinase [Desulfobacterales bacterium]
MKELSEINTREGLLKVINALPLAITVIDKNRTIALANRSTALFVNKEETQLVGLVGGEAFGCINSDDDPKGCGFGQECFRCKLRETIMGTMETEEPREMVETTMVFKEIGERHLRISTLPMVLNDEPVVLLSLEDITQAKTHERLRTEKEKLAAAVETAGAVCHEINQPLMIILGMAELLLDDIEDSDDKKSKLSEIKEQAERLGAITRKLTSLTEYKTKSYLKANILDIETASDKSDS